MSKRETKNLPEPMQDMSPPELKTLPNEEVQAKTDFTTASELPFGFKVDHTSGVILLSHLLRRIVAAHLGPEQLRNLNFEYHYEAESENHIFEISVKSHLPGERKMGQVAHYLQRMKLKDQLKDFWRDLDLFTPSDNVMVTPDYFGVAFIHKIDFFNTMRDFIDTATGESLELPLSSLPQQKTPKKFKPYKLDPAQSHREFISTVDDVVNASRETVANIDTVLLQSAFNKPHISLAEYNAYSFASLQEINPETLAFAHFLAVIEQRIRHEDNLGPERDENFQTLYQPLNFSIN